MEIRVALIASTSRMSSGASWSLLRLAIALKRKGITIIIILPERGDIEEKLKKERLKYYIAMQYNGNFWCTSNHINTKNVKFRIKYDVKKVLNQYAQYRIEKIFRKEKINIVHINTLTTYIAAKAAVKREISLIWHIREFMDEDLNIHFFHKKESYDLIRKSTRIIAVSKAIKCKYEENLSNIQVIYNGVSCDRFFANRKILQNETIEMILVGRIMKGKGQYELVQAINMLHDDIKNKIHCNLVGNIEDQQYYEEIAEYIKQNHLESRIHFVEYTDHIEKYLLKADVLCSCSKMEAFGRATVEGMLAKCLVIGSNTGATQEIIEHRRTGLLYENGNTESLTRCIRYIFDNMDEARYIASMGQKEAKEKYTDERNATEIIKIYEEVLKGCRD